MAGDWIPFDKDLPRKVEVIQVASATGRSRHEVCGLLLEFWAWADSETKDGHLDKIGLDHLPGIIGGTDQTFWAAVVSVGWLQPSPAGLSIPHYDRWMDCNAKVRLENTRRQRLSRQKRDTVALLSQKSATKARPQDRTGQERREKREEVCSEPLRSSEPPSANGTVRNLAEPKPAVTERLLEPAEDDPVVMTFPVVGGGGGGSTDWELRQRKVREYGESFPGIDLTAELRKALQWVRDNPAKRKTSRGMPAFLGRWLGKAQDEGRAATNGFRAESRPGVGFTTRIPTPRDSIARAEAKICRVGQAPAVGQIDNANPT